MTSSITQLNGADATADQMRALGLYNYGHFTSLRVEQGSLVKGLNLHVDRLTRDSQKLFDAGVDGERVRALIRQVAKQLDLPVIVRVTVYATAGGLEHPGNTSQPDILISARTAVSTAHISPLSVKTVLYRREVASVKHVGLFVPLFHRREAQHEGFDDALFIDDRSEISEGATWNIGFFDGSQVIWPDADVLPGVTMNLLQTAMTENGIPFIKRTVKISEISKDWTAFATNAAVGVRPIRVIGDLALTDSSGIIHDLQKLYISIPGEPL